MENVVRSIVECISNWDDGVHCTVHFANDGDRHFDFMGIEVKEPGIQSLIKAIESAEKVRAGQDKVIGAPLTP